MAGVTTVCGLTHEPRSISFRRLRASLQNLKVLVFTSTLPLALAGCVGQRKDLELLPDKAWTSESAGGPFLDLHRYRDQQRVKSVGWRPVGPLEASSKPLGGILGPGEGASPGLRKPPRCGRGALCESPSCGFRRVRSTGFESADKRGPTVASVPVCSIQVLFEYHEAAAEPSH